MRALVELPQAIFRRFSFYIVHISSSYCRAVL